MKQRGVNLVGKVKELLLEDMMIYPESYSNDDSDYMTEYELRIQMKSFSKQNNRVTNPNVKIKNRSNFETK
jgi:hypothetical protein